MRVAITGALLSVMVLMLCGVAVAQRPLDPLTLPERRTAEALARQDPRVGELLKASRSRLILVEFVAAKPESREPEPASERQAEVVFYRYDDDTGVRAIVNLAKKAVVDVERLPGSEVPIAPEEVAEAQKLALEQPEVRTALADIPRAELKVEYLSGRTDVEGDPCRTHRCIQLLFRRGRGFLMQPVVIVDMTTRSVQVRRIQ